MTKIFKQDKKDKSKLHQGFFSKKKYERWVRKNHGDAELLLQKLDNYWPDRLDGRGEITISKDESLKSKESVLYIYEVTDGRFFRYRILEEWIVWKK
jgi:hypothetical protein